MEVSFVIAVALGVAVVVVLLVLVAVIVYQRWRISDNNAHIKAFINENIELRELIKEYKTKIK
jgi:FlaG/FlaF family flagellin (archaellin)